RVTPGEIQTSFVVGLVRGDPQQGNNLFVMPPPRRLTATDAPAWFTNMDANNDGFVSDREFLGTPPQFAALDTNQDGLLSPHEITPPQSRHPSNAAPSL
ncbi:MAG: hypothetical protein KDA38_17485, partial [Planctomycetales bacterium]|nr:hypothetical protein [Planctomycetales bacterium]